MVLSGQQDADSCEQIINSRLHLSVWKDSAPIVGTTTTEINVKCLNGFTAVRFITTILI